MSTQVTLTLPDEVYRRAERLAQLSSREVADVLADTIELSLSPVGLKSEAVEPVSALSDEEVMALAELQLASDQDQRLSSLLDKQQAGTLIEAERSELLGLMQVYQESLLRKAQALREAVQRGLREPLEP
jgi:predicted DNA-binding protein